MCNNANNVDFQIDPGRSMETKREYNKQNISRIRPFLYAMKNPSEKNENPQILYKISLLDATCEWLK